MHSYEYFKTLFPLPKTNNTPKFIDNPTINRWGVFLLLLNLGNYGTASVNRVEMISYDLWGWIIKRHGASNLFLGTLISGALSHYVKSPTTQRPPCCEKAKPHGDATRSHSVTAPFFKLSQSRHQTHKWTSIQVIPAPPMTSFHLHILSNEAPDIKEPEQATPSELCLNFWVTKSISIMKWFF